MIIVAVLLLESFHTSLFETSVCLNVLSYVNNYRSKRTETAFIQPYKKETSYVNNIYISIVVIELIEYSLNITIKSCIYCSYYLMQIAIVQYYNRRETIFYKKTIHVFTTVIMK